MVTTRFCPSLNGSLHLGHLWMILLNWKWAKQEEGRFILRFDDLAPAYLGEDTSRQDAYRSEALELLRAAGIEPDLVTNLSEHEQHDLPKSVGGQNLWLRPPSLEGWDNVPCSPALVAARVAADIAEGVTHVIRGEELSPELQFYEFLNHQMNGGDRRLIYVPRLRVRIDGEVTTISKTYGNLQLRDLFGMRSPEWWTHQVLAVGFHDPSQRVDRYNINPDPVIDI